MDAELLRRACELAGLTVRWSVVGTEETWSAFDEDGTGYHMTCPALPAYVAERLVEMVRENGEVALELFGDQIAGIAGIEEMSHRDAEKFLVSATSEQRIRAALEVLGDD